MSFLIFAWPLLSLLISSFRVVLWVGFPSSRGSRNLMRAKYQCQLLAWFVLPAAYHGVVSPVNEFSGFNCPLAVPTSAPPQRIIAGPRIIDLLHQMNRLLGSGLMPRSLHQLLRWEGNNQALVYLPDGEVATVGKDLVEVARSTPASEFYVPVGS